MSSMTEQMSARWILVSAGLIMGIPAGAASAEGAKPSEQAPRGGRATLVSLPPVVIHKAQPSGLRIMGAFSPEEEGGGQIDRPSLVVRQFYVDGDGVSLADGSGVTLPTARLNVALIRHAGARPIVLAVEHDGVPGRLELGSDQTVFIGPPRMLESTHHCECACNCDIPGLAEVYQFTTPCDTTTGPDPCPTINGSACQLDIGGQKRVGTASGCIRIFVPNSPPPPPPPPPPPG